MENNDYYKDRFYLFYDYLSGTDSVTEHIEGVKNTFDDAYQSGNTHKMKTINTELDHWLMKLIDPVQKEALRQLLKQHLNEDIDDVEYKRISKMESLIHKRIETAGYENRTISGPIDDVFDMDERMKASKRLNDLLSAFYIYDSGS